MADIKNSDRWVLIIKSWMTLDLYGGNEDGPSVDTVACSLAVSPCKDLQLSSWTGIGREQSEVPGSSSFPFLGHHIQWLAHARGEPWYLLLQFKTLHGYSLLSCLWDWLKGITFLFSSSCCPHSLTSTVQRTLLKKLSLCKYPAQSGSPEI